MLTHINFELTLQHSTDKKTVASCFLNALPPVHTYNTPTLKLKHPVLLVMQSE